MKKNLLILVSILYSQLIHAQITGPDTVCVEYRYSYTASITNAVTYTWTLPGGWYFLSGQGTDSVFVNANDSVGQVCVTGYDAGNVAVGTLCKDVFWGGSAGTGWDAILIPGPCPWSPSFIAIQPNGSGGGPSCGTCSGGIPNPNIVYGVYDATWPFGTYQGQANGIDPFPPFGLPGIYTYYIYLVDITPGTSNAYLVEGGCGGSGSGINSVTLFFNGYTPPLLAQSPDPVCVGDTVIVSYPPNTTYPVYWSVFGGATIVGPTYDIQCTLVVNSTQFTTVSFNDNVFPCPFAGTYDLNIITCAAPVAAFTSNNSIICEQNCVSFSDQSSGNATSWQWSFPGASTTSSNLQFPTNICYNTAGTYDVQLIVCNSQGCDTLLLPNYITVNANPPIPNVTQSTDTLFCNNGYVSYSWYESNNPTVVIGTDSFFVAQVSGNYFVVVTNSSGCTASSTVFSYQGNAPTISIASSDSTFCEKNCLDFFDLSQNNPVAWHWYFPGASPDTSSFQNPTGICYNTYGSYSVQLVACNTNGCDSVAFTNFITVYQTPPQPNINVSNDTLYCTATNVTYAWYNTLNPGQLLGSASFYYAPVAGIYFVIVTDTNGCEVSSNTTTITTGINSIGSQEFIINYEEVPKWITIDVKSFTGKIKCTIANALGQTILSKDFISGNENLIIPFDKKSGVYFLNIKAEQKNYNYKFVIR